MCARWSCFWMHVKYTFALYRYHISLNHSLLTTKEDVPSIKMRLDQRNFHTVRVLHSVPVSPALVVSYVTVRLSRPSVDFIVRLAVLLRLAWNRTQSFPKEVTIIIIIIISDYWKIITQILISQMNIQSSTHISVTIAFVRIRTRKSFFLFKFFSRSNGDQ